MFTFIVCFLLFPVQLGKSVVASKDIPAGTELTYDLLTVKVAEPKGYQPEIMSDLIGKRTKKALAYDDSVRGEDVVMEWWLESTPGEGGALLYLKLDLPNILSKLHAALKHHK